MKPTHLSLARLAGAVAFALAAGSAFAQATPAGTWKTMKPRPLPPGAMFTEAGEDWPALVSLMSAS